MLFPVSNVQIIYNGVDEYNIEYCQSNFASFPFSDAPLPGMFQKPICC